ncbi:MULTISPECIES: hypothetical protein [Pseudomonadales]|uniref:hypothetical protein n=1 Tax=Pseudomonadales TaxID=72274 RepID=UPI003A925C96
MAGSSRKSIGLNLALTLMAWGFSSFLYAESGRFYIPAIGNSTIGATREDACSLIPDDRISKTWYYGGATWQLVGFSKADSYCRYDYKHPTTGEIRVGASSFQIYAFSDCLSVQGQTKEFRGPDSPIIWSGTSGFVSWSESNAGDQCFEACNYTGAAKTTCYLTPGSTDSGFCNFMAGADGDNCSGSDPLASSGEPIVRPDPIDPPDPTDPTNPGGGDGGGSGGGGADGSNGPPLIPPDAEDTTDPDPAAAGDVATLGNRLVDATYAAANGVISAINGVGNKVDGVGKKVDGLGDKIDDLGDSLQGESYSEGEGEGAGNADGIGDEAGDSLADLINSAVDEAKQARTDSFNEEVDKVDGMLGEWFGEDASGVGGAILDGLFPKSSSCSEFNVVWHAKGYSLTLPVCELTRLKSILEWVFGILTAIAVWRILMNTLNQAAASAVRYS